MLQYCLKTLVFIHSKNPHTFDPMESEGARKFAITSSWVTSLWSKSVMLLTPANTRFLVTSAPKPHMPHTSTLEARNL